MDSSDASSVVDSAQAIREGETLDTAKLKTYLASVLTDGSGEISIAQFRKGHSNLTYLIDVGQRELVLRRPPFGAAIKSAHDMGREYSILSALDELYDKAPKPIHYCEDAEVIGAPFYLMERVSGVILRGNRPPRGLEISAETMRGIALAAVDNLATLHGLPARAGGLADLGRPKGYVERQVHGWTKRYFDAKTDEVPQVEHAAAWLAENMPGDCATPALIHGDYKYDNLVLDADDLTRIVSVLDWEMATVGDPLMDLGTSLGYWLDPDDPPAHKLLPFGPTLLPGNPSRREVIERYAEKSGCEVGDALFYYVYGLFKIIVIAQQIYKRFVLGHTKDPRFGAMIIGVKTIGDTAARALERDRIDGLG